MNLDATGGVGEGAGDIAREPTVADHVCHQDRRFLLP